MAAASRSVEDILEDIVLWGARLARHVAGIDRERFEGDEKTQDAATKCVEVVGEAAAQLLKDAPEMEHRYPELELRAARATRNQLSHGYFAIDLDILWLTAQEDVPNLVEAARRILRERRRPGA